MNLMNKVSDMITTVAKSGASHRCFLYMFEPEMPESLKQEL